MCTAKRISNSLPGDPPILKIGVISDTHLPTRAKKLPQALLKGLDGVDLILHAGDWMTLEVEQMLSRIAPVDGVAGNNDGPEILHRFHYKKLLELNGRRIGIVHGHDVRMPPLEKAQFVFRDDEPDVIIFGHSHIPFQQQDGNTLLLNPGSPTDKRWQPQYSYAILDIQDEISARLYYYDSKE